MGIIDTSKTMGGELAGAANGLGNTAGQLRVHWLRMTGEASDSDWATSYGVASGNRGTIQDVIIGMVTITQNSTGASLVGLWARIAEMLGVALPIMAQSTTDKGRAVARLMQAYGTQISTVIYHDTVLGKLIDDGNQATATTLYGPSGADLTALKKWTGAAATLLDNFAGTAITDGEQWLYKLAYEAA